MSRHRPERRNFQPTRFPDSAVPWRADEYHPGAVTGPLSVSLVAAYANVATGLPVNFTALIDGHATGSTLEFGDSVVASNRPYASEGLRPHLPRASHLWRHARIFCSAPSCNAVEEIPM